MKTTILSWAMASFVVLIANGRPAQARELSIQDRVDAQSAIEQVYWRHRIWPSQAPQPKPEFSVAMSEATIRDKVGDELARAAILEQRWQRSIGREQLQDELNRIAAESKDPAMLAELFDALHDDPELIAETLVRPLVGGRLLLSLYARDAAIHADVRRIASRALVEATSFEQLRGGSGVWSETEYVRGDDELAPTRGSDGVFRITLDPEAWDRRRSEWRPLASTAGAVSPLEESDDAFYVQSIVSADADRVRVASVSWPKRPFDAWWSAQRARYLRASPPVISGAPYVLPSISASACTVAGWSGLSTFVPVQREAHTAVWTGSEMVVWGGKSPAAFVNDGGRYTPATDSWRPMTVVGAPQERELHTAVWTGSEMIVWGGHGSAMFGNGARYNPMTDTWAPMSSIAAPVARQRHSAVWTGSEMIVWGGNSCNETCPPFFNSGGRYSPSTDTWAATATSGAPEPRISHVAVWTGSRMIVWGGSGSTGVGAPGGTYDPMTDSWTPISTVNAPGYQRAPVVWTGSEMIVWGGTPSAAGGRYNPVTDAWTTMSATGAPAGRSRHAAVWSGTQLILWGGLNRNGVPLTDGGRYSPTTDSWTTMTTTGAPAVRTGHTAIWTGSEMLVWGGATWAGSPKFFSGGRYSPVSDSWTPTRTNAPAPTARSGAVGVWTGAEMVVWGGSSVDEASAGRLGTGGRYDPALDTWTATTTSGAPSARDGAKGVWTGERVLMWGGHTNAGRTDTGGGYRPADDSWVTLSTSGAPTPRNSHTAIWDGDELIVWGGSDNTSHSNTGGRYRPSTDSWTATSTGANVPVGRYSHTAVWTGTEMIVWGGRGSSQTFGSGGRYNPVTDAWVATPIGGSAPNARYLHSAVWTGTEMIVWGGDYTGSNPANTGARYNPQTNQWVPTSLAGAPWSRFNHAAYWTGTSMMIWGGTNGVVTNHGAFYSPTTDSWSLMSWAGLVPYPRDSHCGAWTGSEILVWGGLGVPGTGGRYCACAGGSVQRWYRDADGDGFGNSTDSIDSCATLSGYSLSGGDCNDSSTAIHPNAPDAVCNGVDDDCDGSPDDGYVPQPTSCGVGACASAGALTCASGQVHDTCMPGTPTLEVCNGNGLDDDCDGAVDNVPLPSAMATLSVAKIDGSSEWSWTALPNATGYDVTRGDLGALRVWDGDFAQATQSCVASEVGSPSVVDAETPAEGAGIWYLARGVNCDGVGTYDDGSASLSGSRDPGIFASGLGCP